MPTLIPPNHSNEVNIPVPWSVWVWVFFSNKVADTVHFIVAFYIPLSLPTLLFSRELGFFKDRRTGLGFRTWLSGGVLSGDAA